MSLLSCIVIRIAALFRLVRLHQVGLSLIVVFNGVIISGRLR